MTFAGLIMVVLGWFGVSHIITSDNVATIIDNIVQIVGIVVAAIGRYRAGGVNALGFKK